MILVIADDFTGAAELAGIAIGFGLKVEVQTNFMMNSEVDVIIVDTNSRSKTIEEAVIILENLLESVMKYEYDFLYKKTDSVLRGHVYEELSVLLKYFGNTSILLSPTNPSRNRTISHGTYFIGGKPIHETVFSDDPESPVMTSDVYSLMKRTKEEDRIKILDAFNDIPQEPGMIYIGEARNNDEVKHWVNQIDANIISAGAADFFKHILESHEYHRPPDNGQKINFDKRNTLFVCGSSLSRVINIEEELFSKNPKVVEVLEDEICSGHNTNMAELISEKIIKHFKITNNVILFVNTSGSSVDVPTQNIPKCLAAITSFVLDKIELEELFVEGGTTSSEIVRKIGWTRFNPVNQIGAGLVRMQVIKKPSNFITVKPGSYKWSMDLWHQM